MQLSWKIVLVSDSVIIYLSDIIYACLIELYNALFYVWFHCHSFWISELRIIDFQFLADGTGEVINTAEEATSNTTEAIQLDANGMNSEESCGCSILTECDDEDTEFQSPKASHGGDSDFIILWMPQNVIYI